MSKEYPINLDFLNYHKTIYISVDTLLNTIISVDKSGGSLTGLKKCIIRHTHNVQNHTQNLPINDAIITDIK